MPRVRRAGRSRGPRVGSGTLALMRVVNDISNRARMAAAAAAKVSLLPAIDHADDADIAADQDANLAAVLAVDPAAVLALDHAGPGVGPLPVDLANGNMAGPAVAAALPPEVAQLLPANGGK